MSFSGPWYEREGPNSEYIRKDVKKKFMNTFKINSQDEQIVENILKRRIPVDFIKYSWRGYATFGIVDSIMYQTRVEFSSLKVLRCHLVPIINHRLYRYPDGLRLKKLRQHFELGKFKLDCRK